METRASQVEDFGCQQALLVALTHIKLINHVRIAASGGVRIPDVLRHVKREAAEFDKGATAGYLMSLRLSVNSNIGYLVRYYFPIFSLCHILKVLGCLFEQLEH